MIQPTKRPDLENLWKAELSKFQETRASTHLQAAGDALFSAITRSHGEHVAIVALQAGGWPRPWERSFSFPPSQGCKSHHDAIVHDMLKDVGEGLGQWEDLPHRDVLALMDEILIRRNRRNSPLRAFGKAADSGLWPHDDSDRNY